MSSLQGDVDHDKRDSIQSKGECRRRWEERFDFIVKCSTV